MIPFVFSKPQPLDGEPLKLLLIDDVARRLFEKVLTSRRIRFNQLLATEPEIGRDQLRTCLQRLVDRKLVALLQEPPIEELHTYYVTQAGLTAEQRLRQIETA